MEQGVPILGTITKPCKINMIKPNEFSIVITQGLNRQIRRMCEYFDLKVISLKRTRIMNINLGNLKVGNYRNITLDEFRELENQTKGMKYYNE